MRSPEERRIVLEESQMQQLIARFVREDEGQDLIEYALLATLIALVAGAGRDGARHQPEHLVPEAWRPRCPTWAAKAA